MQMKTERAHAQWSVCLCGVLAFARRAQQPAQKKPLDIYFLDTEGGQATLFVSPSGQSMLVDTGFPGNQGMPPAEANAPASREMRTASWRF